MLKQKGLFGSLLLISSSFSWASCGPYIGLGISPQAETTIILPIN